MGTRGSEPLPLPASATCNCCLLKARRTLSLLSPPWHRAHRGFETTASCCLNLLEGRVVAKAQHSSGPQLESVWKLAGNAETTSDTHMAPTEAPWVKPPSADGPASWVCSRPPLPKHFCRALRRGPQKAQAGEATGSFPRPTHASPRLLLLRTNQLGAVSF